MPSINKTISVFDSNFFIGIYNLLFIVSPFAERVHKNLRAKQNFHKQYNNIKYTIANRQTLPINYVDLFILYNYKFIFFGNIRII